MLYCDCAGTELNCIWEDPREVSPCGRNPLVWGGWKVCCGLVGGTWDGGWGYWGGAASGASGV